MVAKETLRLLKERQGFTVESKKDYENRIKQEQQDNLNEWVTVKVNVREHFKKFHNLNLEEISEKLSALKKLSNKPVVTGFGIKTVEDVENLKNLTDGIVIGSPIVEKINLDSSLTKLKKYLEPIVGAIKA